jgi:hypothetical protein
MIDSTTLAVVDESPAGPLQLIVETDAGGQAEKTLQDPLFEARKRASSMTFEREDVFAGPEDGFDPLPNGSKMRTFPGLILSLGSKHGGFQVLDPLGEVPADIAFVAEQGLATDPPAVGEELKTDLAFVPFGRGQLKGSGCPVKGEDSVQPKPPEVAGVRRAVSIVGHVGKGRTANRLSTASALDGRGVDEQEIVGKSRAFGGKDTHQPVDGIRESPPPFVVTGLAGNLRKEVHELPAGGSQEAAIRRDAHDGLSHREGDDLSIGAMAAGVGASLWQKIIGCAINDGAEGVEVGVHRGLLVDGVANTADFGPSASNPFCAVILVESII